MIGQGDRVCTTIRFCPKADHMATIYTHGAAPPTCPKCGERLITDHVYFQEDCNCE